MSATVSRPPVTPAVLKNIRNAQDFIFLGVPYISMVPISFFVMNSPEGASIASLFAFGIIATVVKWKMDVVLRLTKHSEPSESMACLRQSARRTMHAVYLPFYATILGLGACLLLSDVGFMTFVLLAILVPWFTVSIPFLCVESLSDHANGMGRWRQLEFTWQ